MTDISERRRRAGRLALGLGAALALPLTATVVYAGQDAPEPPAAPVAPAAPEAPTPPEARKVEKRVIVMHHEDGEHGDHKGKAKFERKLEKDGKTIVIRSDKPIDEAELEAKLEKLEKHVHVERLLPEGEPGEHRAVRKVIVLDKDGKGPHEGHALAFAMAKCKDGPLLADADASRESADADGKKVERTRIVMCGKPGHGPAEALVKVRAARDRIAASDKMSDEMRADILRQLDESIARLEKGGE